MIFDALPGEPVPAGGEAQIDAMAATMGSLLAAFRLLPVAGLSLDSSWANPARLAARAADWAVPGVDAPAVVESVPELFAGRPAVLAHGEFAPVNVLTDGEVVTGLLCARPRRRRPRFRAG